MKEEIYKKENKLKEKLYKGKCIKKKIYKKKIYKNGYLFINKKSTLNNKEGAIRSCSIRVLLLKYYSKSFFLKYTESIFR